MIKKKAAVVDESVLYLREVFVLKGREPDQGDQALYQAFQRLLVTPENFGPASDGSGWVMDVSNLRVGGFGEGGEGNVQAHIDCSHNILFNGGPGEKHLLLLNTEKAMAECPQNDAHPSSV